MTVLNEIVKRSFKLFYMILKVWVHGIVVSNVKAMRIIPYGQGVFCLYFLIIVRCFIKKFKDIWL